MKKLIHFFIFLLTISNVTSQVTSAKKFSSSANDLVESIASDSNGNYYAMGTFANTITFDSAGNNILFSTTKNEATYIAKYDCNDNYQWVTIIDNTTRSALMGALKFKNGFLYAVTNFSATTTITSPDGSKNVKNAAGIYAGILFKFDTDGLLQWSNIIQSPSGKVELNDVEFSHQNDIYIAGAYQGTATVLGQGGSSITSSASKGSIDAIYIKFNANGVAQWLNTGGGAGDDFSGYIKFDSKDNLYISHQFSSNAVFGSFNVNTPAQWGSIFSKVSTVDGTILWLNYTPAPTSVAGGIQIDNADNIYFIGSMQGTKKFKNFTNTYTKSITANGGYDIYIAKYDMNGDILWIKNYGGLGDEYSWRSLIRNNNIYLHFQYDDAFSMNSFNFPNAGSQDEAIVCFDTSGTIKMGKTINGSNAKKGYAIEYSNTGRLFVGGAFGGTISSNAISLTSSGADDGYIYIYDSVATSKLILNSINTVCKRKSVVIQTGMSAGTFKWSPGTEFNDSTIASPTLTPAKSGYYVLKYTTLQGCIFFDTVIINTTFCTIACTDCDTNKSINKNLVFCLPFSGNANDETGNGYNGNIHNLTPTNDRYGLANSAYIFNGSSSYIDIAKVAPDLTSSSLSFWVKSGNNITNPYGGMVVWDGDNTCGLDYFLSIKDSTLYLGANKNSKQLNGSAGNGIQALPNSLSKNWNHIVWVLEPTVSYIYLNGILQATINKTGSLVGNHGTFTIGALNDGGGGACGGPKNFYFNGMLDDIRLYSKSLSAPEVSYLYDPLDTIIVGSDITICKGDSALLGVPPLGNKWKYYILSGDANSLIGVNKVKPNISSIYLLKDTTTNCTRYDTIYVTVKTIAGLDAGIDTTICRGDSVQLNGNGIGIVNWLPINNISNSNILNPIAFPNFTTDYILNITANGCTIGDTVRIKVDTIPVFSLGGIQNICRKDSIQLTTVAGYKYKWSPFKWMNNPNIYNPVVKPDSNITYYLKLTSGVCTLNDSVQIIVQNGIQSNNVRKTICENDSFQLNATGGISYTWSTSYGLSDSTIGNPKACPSINTKYICKKISATGCIGYDTVIISIDKSIIIPQATNDTTICAGQPLQLTASGGATYSWSPGLLLNDSNINNPIASLEKDISFIVSVTGSKGCTKTDTVNITVLPIMVSAGPDPVACNVTDSIQLQASGCLSYIWTPNLFLSNDTISNPKLQPQLSNSTYIVTGKAANGCTRSDTLNVFFSIVKADAGPDADVCGLDSALLNASGGVSYSWLPSIGLSDPLINNPKAHPDFNSYYYVLVTDSLGCQGTDSVYLTLKPKADIYTISFIDMCKGDLLTLYANGSGYYTWSNGNVDSTTIVSPSENTTYYVFSNPPGYCQSDTATINITVYPKPSASFNVTPKEGIRPLTVNFSNTSKNALKYVWHYGNGDTDIITSPQYIYNNWGIYNATLIATNQFNCSDSSTTTIIVRDSFFMFVPNSFTPNNNKKNDFLAIDYDQENVIEGYLRIYNRWGEKVYDGDLKNYQPWDGTFHGKQVAEDVYILVWYLTDKSKTEHHATSTLTILR